MELLKAMEQEQMKSDIPDFRVGYNVAVHLKVVEGNRERIQVFEGVVIDRNNTGLRETFTVRRISRSIGVERKFLLHSPLIEKIEITKRGKVKKAKLYFLRDKVGKAIRIKEER